jgi:hypothetical protein
VAKIGIALLGALWVGADSGDQRRNGVAGHLQQRVQQMRRFGVRVALSQGSAQRGRDCITTLGGQLAGIHVSSGIKLEYASLNCATV